MNPDSSFAEFTLSAVEGLPQNDRTLNTVILNEVKDLGSSSSIKKAPERIGGFF
jgi:hypothetical protein